MKRPRTDQSDSRARLVAEHHAKGLGRNEIARATGIPAATVTVIARALGLSFERTATAAAVEAKRQDNAVLRGQLIDRLYREANRKLTQLESEKAERWPTLVRGEGGIEETRRLDYIPAKDYAQVSQSVGYLVTHAARLEAVDNPAGQAAVSLLSSLAAQFGVKDA